MSESKFINKATTEYLKSKAGATVQQQIQNIKERIDLESNDLSILSKNQELHRSEWNNEISHLRNVFFEEMNDRMTKDTELQYQLEDLKSNLAEFSKFKRKIWIAVIALGVVEICQIIKLLI